MTSYKARINSVLLFVIILAASMAFADKKDDLYAKGSAAVSAGDAIAAKAAFCQLASEDSGYKDAKAQCATYTIEATNQLNRFRQNFTQGVALMQEGKLAEAEFKFRNVKAGEHADDAKQKLVELAKLKQDKATAEAAAKQNADLETQMKAKLDQGNNAYSSGDFNGAKAALSAITSGAHQAEAQATLGKIRNYEAKMAEAGADAANKNYAAAATAYSEAVRINPSGPGDPLGLVGKMNQLSTTSASQQTVAANNPPSPAKTAATKDVVKTIDVAKYNSDGKKAMAKGDFKKARRFFQEVLGQDPRNQDAIAAMAELKSKDTAQAAVTDEDPLLAKLIRGYYEGSYNEIESLLNSYIYQAQGKKLGLANFYAGASILTRYYLAGGTDENLRREAKKKFKAAKDTPGFKAPEKFVSPKIMKVFAEV